jgi:aspartate/methionine/tyrosine aminotransferase
MILVCNPNNPTGYILTKEEMKEIVEIARSADAWVFCDEIYRGAELSGVLETRDERDDSKYASR